MKRLLHQNYILLIQSTLANECNNYAVALNTQRNYCGDVDVAIQVIIDSLGGCQISCE